MKKYFSYTLLVNIFIFFSACGVASLAKENSSEWSLNKALIDAKNDFHTGKIQIMYGGTLACIPLGLSLEEQALVRQYPITSLGCGCTMSQTELQHFYEKSSYGAQYNKTIVSLIRMRR